MDLLVDITFLSLLLQLCQCIPPPPILSPVYVDKCCDKGKVLIDDNCIPANETKFSEWMPDLPKSINYTIVTGLPNCGHRQLWHVYHNASDRLHLQLDGTLRHFIVDDPTIESDEIEEDKHLFYDYADGLYCMEKVSHLPVYGSSSTK